MTTGFALQFTATFILLLTLQIDDVAAKQSRSRRQTVTSFNLRALKDACCEGNQWSRCCAATKQLLNESVQQDFQCCRLKAQEDMLGNTGIVIDIENPVIDIENPDDVDNDCHQAEDLQEATGKACPFNKSAKAEARKKYCYLLRLVDIELKKYVPILGTTCGCNEEQYSERREGSRDSHFDYQWPHSDYQLPHSPAAVLKGVQLWHRDMVELHGLRGSLCCGNDPKNNTEVSSLEEVTCSHISNAPCSTFQRYYFKYQWDKNLAKVAKAMRMVELLECLGRRTTCLRGCIGLKEVLCADMLR